MNCTKNGVGLCYVLEKANNNDDQNELKVAIQKCTTHDIMTYIGSEAAPEHISHELLHMIVQRYPLTEQHKAVDRYSTYFIDAAMEYVAQKLAGNIILSLS
jgi:Zn-dependent peptidase ImmA (M78 family)